MSRESAGIAVLEPTRTELWRIMLRDEVSLLAMPGAHHKTLLRQAHALHEDHLIDAEELGELMELADAALAYAIEALLDIDTAE